MIISVTVKGGEMIYDGNICNLYYLCPCYVNNNSETVQEV